MSFVILATLNHLRLLPLRLAAARVAQQTFQRAKQASRDTLLSDRNYSGDYIVELSRLKPQTEPPGPVPVKARHVREGSA